MAEWLPGIDPRDVVRIEIVRVTLEGTPSCVTEAMLALTLRDGRVIVQPATFGSGTLYESLVALVCAANRRLSR